MSRSILFVLLLAAACGPVEDGAVAPDGRRAELVAGAQKNIRETERARLDEEFEKGTERQTELEKNVLHAVQHSLGLVADNPYRKGPMPAPASASIKALRTKYKLRVVPQLAEDGQPRFETLVGLQSSADDAVPSVQTPETRQTLRTRSKDLSAIVELREQLLAMSTATWDANRNLQFGDIGLLVDIGLMTSRYKMYEAVPQAEDYARVKRALGRLRRQQAIGAATLGMLAAYQAAINDGADPKALDAIGASASAGLEAPPEVTDDEAKSYVEDLKGKIDDARPRYEAWMRKTYGNTRYEKQIKGAFDTQFAIAQSGVDQRSILPPANGEAQPSSSEAAPKTKTAAPRTGADIADVASAVAKELPSDGPLRSSLDGLAAIAHGDPKGAIMAAIGLLPGGGLVKDGLSLATNLLFGAKKP